MFASQRREARNITRVQQRLQEIIDDRKKNLNKAEGDMISVLLGMNVFDDQEIIAQVWTMFFAGMKTIQISTTNFVQNILANPAIRDKLLSEIRPPLDACKGEIRDRFTYETAMEFEFLKRCYWETIRLEPPAPVTFFQSFSRDVTIGPNKVKISKDVDI